MPSPQYGVTVEAHVLDLLCAIQATATDAIGLVREPTPMTKRERESLSRQLAGAVGNLETVRIWLDKGAPK